MRRPRVLLGLLPLWLCLALCGLAAPVSAAPGAYTDAAAFAAGASGPVASYDFEALPAGTPLSGATLVPTGTLVGIVLPGPVPDVLDAAGPGLALTVVENPGPAGHNPASSGVRSLGVVDPGNFDALVAGTELSFSFTQAVDAFGLVLVTPEEPGEALFDLDARLQVPGEATAQLSLSAGQPLGSFGDRDYVAYFLGVVGASPFSQATLRHGPATPDASFLFNVDDLVIAVPEPGAALSLLAGGLLLAALARRR